VKISPFQYPQKPAIPDMAGNKLFAFIIKGFKKFWKGLRAVTRLLDTPYENGIKVFGKEKSYLEQRLQRSPALHWWDITISSKMVNL
jgi:hypothetical protein